MSGGGGGREYLIVNHTGLSYGPYNRVSSYIVESRNARLLFKTLTDNDDNNKVISRPFRRRSVGNLITRRQARKRKRGR